MRIGYNIGYILRSSTNPPTDRAATDTARIPADIPTERGVPAYRNVVLWKFVVVNPARSRPQTPP